MTELATVATCNWSCGEKVKGLLDPAATVDADELTERFLIGMAFDGGRPAVAPLGMHS